MTDLAIDFTPWASVSFTGARVRIPVVLPVQDGDEPKVRGALVADMAIVSGATEMLLVADGDKPLNREKTIAALRKHVDRHAAPRSVSKGVVE